MDEIATTLVDVLRRRAEQDPDHDGYVFLADGENESARLSWAAADRRARAIAAVLRDRGGAGERALITYPAEDGPEFLTSFLGCLYAGVVAVPCDAAQGRAGAERLGWIARDARPRFVLGPAGAAHLVAAGGGLEALDGLDALDVAPIPDEAAGGWRDADVTPDDLALLQYTSGSTGNPRGVMVTHGNVMANERAIRVTCEHDGDSSFVGWLPLYHDMGLIANLLQPLYLGSCSILMPPAAFLARPMRWLEAVSRYRGVTSGGPNFAYDLCAARVRPEDYAGLDLSSWRVAFNGAEVVRAGTLQRFFTAFAPAGFSPTTFFPCYGLAEGTLIVSGAPRGVPPRTFAADRAELRSGRCVPPGDGQASRTLVGSGRPVVDTRVLVVDPETGAGLPDGALGEVWVCGPGVAAGYWERPAETEATFGGGFLRTGDVGTLLDGELYVVARLKDMIIIRGQNHYPEDIENTAERASRALRPSCGAAFSVDIDADTGERLVVLYEADPRAGEPDVEEVAAAVRQAVAERHRIEVHAVVLVGRGAVPKTTSGKVRRLATRDRYLAGALPVLGASVLPDRELPLPDLPDRELRLPDLSAGAEALAAALAEAVGARAGVPVTASTAISAAGLDSLAAVELAHRLQDRYGIELGAHALLGDTTLTDIAAHVLRSAAGHRPGASGRAGIDGRAGGDGRVPPDERAGTDGRAEADERAEADRRVGSDRCVGPLAPMQRALWFEHELAPVGPAYALVRALRLDGKLNRAAFGRAVRRLGERHEALRTRFEERDGEPVQVVTGAAPEVRHEDLPSAGDGVVRARIAAEAVRPFALRGAGPPVRFVLLRLGEAEHVLVVAAHHIVADFWSLVVVLRELLALYEEEAGGPAAQLPPVRTTLIEHALRERPATADLEYWRERLDGVPATLELPADRPRPAVRGFRGAGEPVRLDAALTRRLRALARAHRTTLFTVVLAAYQVLLGRHSGQRDLVVGTLVSGRERAELAGVVGCFVNLVPVRARLRAADTFDALLRRVRGELLADLAHVRYPFSELVGALRPARAPGRPPLVQALLVFQQEYGERAEGLRAAGLGVDGPEFGSDPGAGSGLRARSMAVEQPWTHLDLTLNLAEVGGELRGGFEYDRALFDAPTVEGLARRFEAMLDALTAAPDRPLSQVRLPTAGEAKAALAAGRGAVLARPAGASLHGLVLEACRTSPDAVAVALPAADGTTAHLSYRALRERAARLAAGLAAAGVGPGDVVGVLLPRCLELPVALLAVLQRGAAYLPLEPDDPPARLAWLVRDAGARCVLTDTCEATALGVPVLGVPVLSVTVLGVHRDTWASQASPGALWASPGDTRASQAALGAPSDARVPSGEMHGELAAYVIYTSGSTGRPKGVVVPHRGIVNRLLWMQEALALDAADRVLHKAPTTFDVSLWELFWPLTRGACLVLAPPGAHRDPPRLRALFDRERVTTAHFVPSLLTAFLAGDPAGNTGELPALRRVVCSGEALPAGLRDRALRALPSARLFNLYGPTETSVDVTAWECRRGEHGPVPIGLPIANTDAHVLDPALQPLPPRVRGELCIGGAGLARGYLGRPGLTAASFVPDVHSARPGSRLYRTGDQARRRPDGVIEYLGRTDHQVKVAGVRIELGEVEDALRAQPGVRDAAVTAYDTGAGPALAAYVSGAGLDAAAVVAGVRGRLPSALVPSAVVVLDALPTTPSGKLDRAALPPPSSDPARTTEPPRPGAEHRIALLWSDVLGVPGVGADDDFFALGGDSIRALRLVARLRDDGIPVTVADLLAAGTVRGVAAMAARSLAAGSLAATWDADPEPFALCPPSLRAQLPPGVRDAYPVSMAQRAILFHQLGGAGHEVYVTSVHVRAAFDEPAMRAALAGVLDRHAYLRSSFDLATGREPQQLVHGAFEPPLAVLPLGTEAELDGWLRAERSRAFDVTAGPLVRCTVHVRSPEDFQLTLSSFALDGWCTATVITELLLDFAARRAGRPSTLTAPSVGYASFVALEKRALGSPEQREFWAGELVGADPCRLPTRRGAPDGERLTRRLDVTVDADVVAGLRRVARALSVPLKSVLLAAHLRVVRLLCARDTVVTGFEVNGRPEAHDGDRTVGVFNNIVPLRLDTGAGSWAELVRAAFAAERRIMPYRRYPLAQLEREHGAGALFDTMFVYTHFHVYDQVRAVDGVELVGWTAPDQTYVPLTTHFNVDALTGELRLMLDHDPARVPAALAADASGYYLRALARLAADPDAPHAHADLLAPQDLRAQLAVATAAPPPDASTDSASTRAAGVGGAGTSGAGTGAAVVGGAGTSGAGGVGGEGFGAGGEGTVHGRVLQQAGMTPDAVAVCAGGESLTYRELARRSGEVAAALRSAGVGPDALVGLPARRDLDLVVGLLGVLRAGAAYLPVDPDHPTSRLRAMLAQVRAVVARATTTLPLPDGCPVVLPGCHPATMIAESVGSGCARATGADTSGDHARSVGGADVGAPPLPEVHPGQLAYALHTSGTSGAPKVVGVSHAAVCHYLDWCARAYPQGGRTPVHSAVTFDLTVTSLLVPLTLGGTVELTSADTLGDALVAGAGGPLKITPAHFEAVGRQLDGAPVATSCAVVGGEQLRRRHLGPWRLGTVFNEYGPTEATVGCVVHRVDPDSTEDPVPIGRPITGMRAHVLHGGLPVPLGAAAELHVGGPQLARGYLGRPGVTAERFVPDPYGYGERLYRTGDLARLGEDGELRFVGRTDRQLKLRGYRIEPAEIEEELSRHPLVRQAAVVASGPRLVAYWVPCEGLGVGEDGESPRLAGWLAQRLPAHLVPSQLVRLPALPLTAHGKVDHARLADPAVARREALRRLVAGLGEREASELLAAARAGGAR